MSNLVVCVYMYMYNYVDVPTFSIVVFMVSGSLEQSLQILHDY